MSRHVSAPKRAIAREMRSRPTRAEAAAWELLRGRRCLGVKFRRQYGVRGFVVDFYWPALMLAVELDGSAHDGIVGAARDAERSAVLAAEGIAERLTPFLGKRRWA